MAYWQSDLGELGHDFGSRRGAVRFFGYTCFGSGCEILRKSQKASEAGQIIRKNQCFVSGVDFNNPYTRNAFF